MIKRILFILFGCTLLLQAHAQLDSALWQQQFDKAKETMIKQSGQNATLFQQVGQQLDSLAAQNPGNAEVWYFLGCAIDRYNTSSGEEIPSSSLALAEKASVCFHNCLDMCGGVYTGQTILFDPHTKILSVWGAQALRFLKNNQKDSAVWCLQKAEKYGGINKTVKEYFQQVLDECTNSAYLFTNGDLYLYYLTYIQNVLEYRSDVHCISLNFLNTTWYPKMLNAGGILPVGISNDSIANIRNTKWAAQSISIENKSGIIGDSIMSWTLNPTNGDYILRSDIILKDFLQKNAFQNNVFFAADVPENMRLFLSTKNYGQLRGLTLKIVPQKNTTDINYLQHRLANLSDLPYDDSTFIYNKDNIQVLNNYRFAYTAVANLAVQQNNPKTAESVLAQEEQKYPENVLPFFANATKNWFTNFKQKIMDTAVNK